ncbi:unnamed protein product [Triticum turgidum subsp. durum]|uniref:DUF6598 domain-containing protein n=1 Tax=Triticum turgidum subsp. durum TaxID=4567 RepID=A0A9R0Z3Q5_TRITD|nr:unnamed protein product [Triticum turgidum subsp. durum]
MEPDLDMAALRKKLEDEVLGTWLWDRELDSILQEQQERDDEGDYEYYESDQEEEELHYGGSWGYGYTFYYEDGNPYYVADMEERWENQMRFPPTRSCAKRSRGIWEGSLQVEGPCQLDPTLLSAQSLLPPLPRSENRWVDKRENEPCRRAIQVFSLNLSSPHDAALEVYDEEGEDDKVLIDGYSVYAPSFYAEYERLHWHINTGHHGSIDLRMASIPKAVLAVLEFEVHHLGDNLFDSLTITAVYRTMQGGAFSVFNGKLSVCRLPSVTVCVDYTKNLTIDLYTYNSHSGDDNCYPDGVVGDSKIPGYFHYDIDDIMSDTVWFKPQKSGSSTKHSTVNRPAHWSTAPAIRTTSAAFMKPVGEIVVAAPPPMEVVAPTRVDNGK